MLQWEPEVKPGAWDGVPSHWEPNENRPLDLQSRSKTARFPFLTCCFQIGPGPPAVMRSHPWPTTKAALPRPRSYRQPSPGLPATISPIDAPTDELFSNHNFAKARDRYARAVFAYNNEYLEATKARRTELSLE